MKNLFLLVLTACGQVAPASDAAVPDAGQDSSTDVTVQDAADGSANDATEEEAASDGGACTYLLSSYPCNSLPEGTLVTVGCTSQPPAPQGGTLVDGVYNLVQTDWDTTATDAACPSGLTRRGTIEVCGGSLLWLDYDETSAIWRGNTSINASGTSIKFQEFCSGNESWSFNYTTDGTKLVMFWQYPQGERLIMTFTRQ